MSFDSSAILAAFFRITSIFERMFSVSGGSSTRAAETPFLMMSLSE